MKPHSRRLIVSKVMFGTPVAVTDKRLTEVLLVTFVCDKEKELVTHEGSTQRAAELIQVKGRLVVWTQGVDRIGSIEGAVA